MADQQADILLIGGGVASACAAATLRDEGFTGSVVLVTREADAPYRRPPTTKGYLQGRETREEAYVHPPEWWEQAGVSLRTRAGVLALDTGARTATLVSKDVIHYGQALVATGAMVRRLTVEGAGLEGVHYLRAPGNADRLRKELDGAKDVVCIGGSYISSEVAASLTGLGHRVTMVMLEDQPLSRQFGDVVGGFFRSTLESHGIEVVSGEEVAAIEEHEGRAAAVLTATGRRLPADVVVCGVGAVPDVMLARKAGLDIGPLGGVACDTRLRTSATGVFAAGDMCEYESVLHDRAVRIEHEDVAETQGATVARNMLGGDLPHDTVPYFFSALSDWVGLEYVGPAYSWDQGVVRGEPAGDAFSVYYLEQGRVRGMLSVGGHGDLDRGRALIRSREVVKPQDL
jgi:3-phenylpropionate/trans-cinnamate dioxygenase ferredoxin reductase subunit